MSHERTALAEYPTESAIVSSTVNTTIYSVQQTVVELLA